MEAQEKERQRIRQSNLVMLTASTDVLSATQPVLNDNVTICCPSCQEGKEVDMHLFWNMIHLIVFENKLRLCVLFEKTYTCGEMVATRSGCVGYSWGVVETQRCV